MLIYSFICFIILLLLLLWLQLISISRSYFISFKIFTFILGWEIEFFFNKWVLLFIFVVLFISLIVIFFVRAYFSTLFVKNFLILYRLFVFRIIWLIINVNFYWIILGWDGLGVVSFLLISYYQNYERNSNALFTLFQNRLGDLFFILFLVLRLYSSFSLNLTIIWSRIFLIFGARVKRAQFPFNAWLLAAISAPTPISSLVHSSTLVVAGVYILLQYRYCFLEFRRIIFFLRITTLVYSLFGLLIETDIKKLIAYSTISHVGLILLFYSQSLFKLTYFHLITHAIFKSIIFICFGFCILVRFHRQDYRLTTYFAFFPRVKFFYYYACLCIIGMPFLSAFFSKDFILEKLIEFNSQRLILVIRLLLFLGVRIFYSLRLMWLFSSNYVIIFQLSFTIRIFRLLGIIIISLSVINILISFVFSLSLEYLSIKIYIYYLMLIFFFFFCLGFFFKKWLRFEKFMWFKERFFLNFNLLDRYIYQISYSLYHVRIKLTRIKLILLSNWWGMFLVIFLF